MSELPTSTVGLPCSRAGGFAGSMVLAATRGGRYCSSAGLTADGTRSSLVTKSPRPTSMRYVN